MRLLLLGLIALVGCQDKPSNTPPAPPAPLPASAQNTATIKALEEAIDQRYSHRDRLGLDWKQLFAAARPELERASTRDELVRAIVRLLKHASDPHLSLRIDGAIVMTDDRQPALNASLAQLKQRITAWRHFGRCLSTGAAGDATYVLVNGLENGRCDDLPSQWSKAYAELAATPGMIMDLRGNQGGNEVSAQAIAGYFVDKPVPYVKSESRDPTAASGFAPAVVRTLQPSADKPYGRPVVVLMGPLNMSSAESFLLMMRAAGATLVGSRSRGSSANPQPVDLGGGITLLVPSWRATLLDGTQLEGVGIAPDVEVAVTAAEVAAGDKVLDAGIAELRRRLKP